MQSPHVGQIKRALRLVRERELCGNPHAVPPVQRLLPFSRATLWRKVKVGDFPQPIRISAGITAWRMDEVEAWLDGKPVGVTEPDRLRSRRALAGQA